MADSTPDDAGRRLAAPGGALTLPDLRGPLARVTRPLRVLTPAGRLVALLAVVGLGVGLPAGLDQLRLLGVFALLLLLLGMVVVRAPARVRGRLELRPDRTGAGERATGLLHAEHLGGAPLRGAVVDVEVDGVERGPAPDVGTATARLPALARGESAATRFTLPATSRGVRRVGPATTRRTDPLGLVVRHVEVAAPVELYVRPRVVRVEHLGAGSVHDLEGSPSDEVSMSDLSFHALREYVRGDDLRHVHWRSSARVGQLHVRQYHDTRRSHAVVLVDDRAAAYGRAEELELALSIAASVVVRWAQDGVEVSVGCGPDRASGPVSRVLDTLTRAATAAPGVPLLDAARLLAREAPGTSQLVVVTGRTADPAEVHLARTAFGPDVGSLLVRADLATETGSAPGMLTVTDLDDLPRLLATAARGGAAARTARTATRTATRTAAR